MIFTLKICFTAAGIGAGSEESRGLAGVRCLGRWGRAFLGGHAGWLGMERSLGGHAGRQGMVMPVDAAWSVLSAGMQAGAAWSVLTAGMQTGSAWSRLLI